MSLQFLVAFLFGLAMVLATSVEVFNEPSYAQQPGRPYTKMKPKFVTLKKKYNRALIVYLFIIVFMYSAVAFFPDIGEALANGTINSRGMFNNPTWPLLAVSLVVGFQSALGLKKIERWSRSWLHKWARIPEGARDTTDSLRRSKFNFDEYDNPSILKGKEFTHVRSCLFGKRA